MQQVYSLGEVAQKLGVVPHKITYAITTGHVPDATTRFAGKRVFTESDLQKIALHFGIESSGFNNSQTGVTP